MKSKSEYIDFWIQQAEDDWEAVHTLYKGQKYLQSLFFAHLVIEKLCKALWIKHNDANVPPKIHNLNYLLSFTTVNPDEERKEFLLSLNRFQLEGRYPEYITKMHNICNNSFTDTMIKNTNSIRLWLLENLQ